VRPARGAGHRHSPPAPRRDRGWAGSGAIAISAPAAALAAATDRLAQATIEAQTTRAHSGGGHNKEKPASR